MPVAKIRVTQYGLASDLVECDVLGGEFGSTGDNHRMLDALGEIDTPLQCLHTPQTAAGHGRPALYSQMVGQQGLGLNPVPDSDQGKIRPINFLCFRVDTQWPRGAVAAADVVAAHDEETPGIDGFPRTDAGVPPAGFPVLWRMVPRRMVMTTQGMADEYRIAAGFIQTAVGFVDQGEPGQCAAADQGQGGFEGQGPGSDQTYGVIGAAAHVIRAGLRLTIRVPGRAEETRESARPAECTAICVKR